MASARFIAGVFLSAGFHVVAYVQMSHAKASHAGPPRVVQTIEVETAPPPPPVEEKLPVNEPAPAPAPVNVPAQKTVSPAKPAAAQAGKVLAAEDDAPGVADFTMVQGTGTSYAGGVTTSNGTAKTPSEGAPRVVGGAGNGGAGNGDGAADLSKPARPSSGDWDCKSLFPGAATSDAATVVIVARVRPDGTPESISIVNDPGQGFGPAARACAMRQRFSAAEDKSGRAITASTAPFRVRFTR